MAQAKETPQRVSKLVPALVPACFFATGAAGLIYEVVWNRTLALLMGNTSYSLATLLTVFMAGLALGAWIGGKVAPPGRAGLRLYGILELGVGAYCLILPLLLDLTRPLFAAIYRGHYGSLVRFNLLQFAVVGVLLLIPTTAMGATLPVLTRFLVRRLGLMSRTVATLYALNSGGAFVGVALAGLVLIPSFGARGSYHIAIAVNLVVGLIAVGLSLALPAATFAEDAEEPKPKGAPGKRARATESGPPLGRLVLLLGFGLSGFAAMVYQVAWTRAVALSIGSSNYGFTLIAGAFILGLTAGSLLLGWMGDRRYGLKALAVLPVGIGLSAIATVSFLGQLPIEVARIINAEQSFAGQQWAEFARIFSMFILPTFCMGGMLPIVSRQLARGSAEAGRAVGDAYAANAVGTILGSFCGGFVLIPWIGMRASILVGAVLSGLIGAAFLHHALAPGSRGRWAWVVAAPAIVMFAAATAPRWEQYVMTSGPFLKGDTYVKGASESDDQIKKRMELSVLYYNEGVATVVTVTGDDKSRTLAVGGKTDAYSFATTQNWIAQLPMLLRPNAKRVLIVGLGSGHTLGSVERHANVEAIDVVEISAGVVYAAREYFSPFTSNALGDSRVNVIVGDGRLHLEHSDRKYDVIISQPSNPWIAGAASLFTREAFEAMKQRLEPGGLVCIWFQGFGMPVDTFRTLARTWGEVWKHPSIWNSRIRGEYVLLGSDAPLEIDFEALAEKFSTPSVSEQMQFIHIPGPAHALSYLVTTDDGVRAIAGEVPINTDDNARIEFDTPKDLARAHDEEIAALIATRRVDPWTFVRGDSPAYEQEKALGAQFLNDQYRMQEAAAMSDGQALAIYEAINARNPHDPIASREMGRIRGKKR
jgi:spermidine synthase